ncbi:hypothetical protein [Actinomadura sp. BRA 177]|uniref:hypothetical protein n=1 Tax=Actinomadura sp. BRA 177 TaxID=2745202 RepID=UPI001595ABB4|nr:hypothetical protein [Actinomadura sp. BRA 177]
MVFLHVGAAKSGTTYLQNILWHNRDRLREHGVLYPGADMAAHVRAAFDLRRTFFPGASDPEIPGAWRRLVDEVRDWPGTVIISQELFAPAWKKHVRRALADLDFADVHVVFTARDLARQIPAHWQEDIKNRFDVSFADFVAPLKRPDWLEFEIARLFWTLQDPVYVLERWAANLPPERVHIVTLPRPGAPRDLLWRRFCTATGLAPEDYDLAAPFDNPSLGLAETQFLLRLNTALDRGRLGWHLYNEEVKLFLAQRVLAARPAPAKIVLPAEHLPWAIHRAEEMVEGLHDAGYHIVGDLDELVPAPGPTTAPDPDEPSWADVADVGMEAITALLGRLRDEEDRAAQLAEPEVPDDDMLDMLRSRAGELRELTGRLTEETVPLTRRVAREASERYPAVRHLHGAYRRLHGMAARSDVDTNRR